MSHSKERKEKICLNCKAELNGRFCHVCGQENIEPKESLWGLITHFFHDITHFDGKFFDTVKWLIRRPGFLSREYVNGRRAAYLNPVRMYVFSSAFFFLLFFSFFLDVQNFFKVNVKDDKADATRDDTSFVTQRDTTQLKPGEIWTYKPALADSLYVSNSTGNAKKDTSVIQEKVLNAKAGEKDKASDSITAKKDSVVNSFILTDFTTYEEYEAAQKKLPIEKRDNWLERLLTKREIELRPKYQNDWKAANKELANRFLHYFPQLLFVSLPLIASILMLIYIRRRKEFYFVSHGIFLIHIYIYTFLNLTLFFTVSKIKNSLDWGWMGWLQGLLVGHAVWYVYKAMRIFYKQSRGKTLLKFILLNALTFVILMFLFLAFLLLSFWNM